MPRRPSTPSTTRGAWPSTVSTRAPIRRSGSATRSIGRERSDSSPVSSKLPGWPARTPARRRMSVPAFPQSTGCACVPMPTSHVRTCDVAARPRSPTPRTSSSSSATSSTSTPSERIARTVASVSAERPKPWTRVSPSASAPSSTARCEIDLSPGTATCPTSAAAGSSLTRWCVPSGTRARGSPLRTPETPPSGSAAGRHSMPPRAAGASRR